MMEEIKQIAFDALVAIVLAAIPVVAGFAVQWLRAQARKLEAEKTMDNAYFLEQVAKIAVNAAEQLSMSGKLADKKSYAIATVQAQLDSLGIKADAEHIGAQIEAAVYRELNQGKEATPKAPQ